jgi:hypothetical protein
MIAATIESYRREEEAARNSVIRSIAARVPRAGADGGGFCRGAASMQFATSSGGRCIHRGRGKTQQAAWLLGFCLRLEYRLL